MNFNGYSTVEVDCQAAHFNGFRAGDIFTKHDPQSKWHERTVLVEGYSYNYDGHRTVLWGRIIHENGELDNQMYYQAPNNSKMVLVAKRGDYDPRKDYDFDPDPLKRHESATPVKGLQNARQQEKEPLDNKPLLLDETFRKLCAVVLKGETIDLLRRAHNIFPVKDIDALEKEITRCSSSEEALAINNRLANSPGQYFKGEYSEITLKRMIVSIMKNRKKVDYENILRNIMFWIQKGLNHKIGLDLNFNIPENGSLEDFPVLLNQITQKVTDYLALLFEDGDSSLAEAAVIFNRRPVYFTKLLREYSEPVSAAKHITAVALNASIGFLERAYSYEFKHVVDQDTRIMEDPTLATAVRLRLLRSPYDFAAKRQGFVSLFEEFGEKLDGLFKVQAAIFVSRSDSIDKVFKEINAQTKTTNDLFADFLAVLGQAAREAASESRRILNDDLFSNSLDNARKALEELRSKTNNERAFVSAFKTALEQFAEAPQLDSTTISVVNNTFIEYPLKWIMINGEHKADCTRTHFGCSAGDIVEYNYRNWFLEGFYINNGDITHLALRRAQESKFDFDNVEWIKVWNITETNFKLIAKWGDWKPDKYGFDPLARKEKYEANPNQGPAASVDLIRDAFLAPLEMLYHRVEQAESIDPLGSTIFNKAIERVNNPEGKEIPLALRFMYHDTDIYTVYPFAPPSSSGKNVIRFELSTGCDWNACSYCTLYENEKFSLVKIEAFKYHFDLIKEYLGAQSLRDNFDRVFLSGGNSFIMPANLLLSILGYIREHKEGNIRRIESYATTRAILKHADDLSDIRRGGLGLVYWGVESGSDPVLKMANKGFTSEDIKNAGALLRRAEIKASITIMPGLGGIKYADQHALETATLIAGIYPAYLTLMGAYAPGTPYDVAMGAEDGNRHLTRAEMIAHIQKIRETYLREARNNPLSRHLNANIAAHGPDITPASLNPISFSERI